MKRELVAFLSSRKSRFDCTSTKYRQRLTLSIRTERSLTHTQLQQCGAWSAAHACVLIAPSDAHMVQATRSAFANFQRDAKVPPRVCV